MRVATLFPFLALASLAAAQTVVVGAPEEGIREAYGNVRNSSPTFVFEMKGREIHGDVATPLHAVLYWRLSYDARTRLKSRAEVELDVYETARDGKEFIALRFVGDGTNLYRYDLKRGEVGTTTYGFYGKVPPEHYGESDAPKLLSQLRALTPGPTAYLVRLLTEVNPSGPDSSDRYVDWLPGRARGVFDSVPYPMHHAESKISAAHYVQDPITRRLFFRDDPQAMKYVFFGMDRTNTDRTVAFTMYDARSDPSNPLWEVQSVSVAQRTADRILDLTLTPNTGTVPDWAFAPYRGKDAAAFRPVNMGGH